MVGRLFVPDFLVVSRVVVLGVLTGFGFLGGLRSICADDQPAQDVFKAKSLRRSGDFYVLPGEAELSKRLQSLRGTLRAYSNALAQQQTMELEAQNNKQLLVAYAQQRLLLRQQLDSAATAQERNRLVNALNELGDRMTILNQGLDRTKDIKDTGALVASKREAYIQAVLDVRQVVDRTNQAYRELASSAEVQGALSSANSGRKSLYKVGPTRSYQTNVKAFERLEKLLQSEVVSLRDQNGVFTVDVVLNGKLTKPMIFDTGASLVSIPWDLAAQLGVKPGDQDRTIKLSTADGTTVEGKLVTLDSVRVGQFGAEKVACAVLPAGLPHAPTLLGGSFLRNFSYKLNPETGKLTLSRLVVPTTKARSPQSGPRRK